MPVPRTATVRPPAARAAWWAAASTPAASPLTTVTPACASWRASSAAMCRPYSLARRAPTIAIAGSSGPPGLPRTASTSGGWAMWRSAGGYAPSLQATSVAPALASLSVSVRARPAAVPSEATAAGGTSAAASAPAGASSTARGVPKRSTSAKARRGSSSGTSANASHASAASSRGIVCVGAAMRKRSGYYTRRAVANHLALLHDRTAHVAHARARSRAGGGRRIVGREVLLAGDELAAAEAHAVALRTHREEDGDRIGVGGERVPEPCALAEHLGDLRLLDDHRPDRARRVREAVALRGAGLADPLPSRRRERVPRVEAVTGLREDLQHPTELRGVAELDGGVLRDQYQHVLRRLGGVTLQEEPRARDGLAPARRQRGGGDRGGGDHRGGRSGSGGRRPRRARSGRNGGGGTRRASGAGRRGRRGSHGAGCGGRPRRQRSGGDRGGGRGRADAVAGGRRRGEGEVRAVVAIVRHTLQAHGAVAGGQRRRRR